MIDPKEFAASFKADLKAKIADLPDQPVLVVHQVGDNEASNRYIKGKMKDCDEVGIECIVEHYDLSATPADVMKKAADYGLKPQILQLPVPFDEDQVVFYKDNDVDGFRLDSKFNPCTPKGILMWLDANKIDLCGKNVVIIGRSNIVGKPLARMMLERNATVTICHSHTKSYDLADFCRYADIVVVAVGKAEWFNPSLCKQGNCIIIDVGINFNDQGKLVGDVKTSKNICGCYITPVPGGVGLLTRIALLDNVYRAYTREFER